MVWSGILCGLNCISPMTNSTEQILMCLLILCIYFFGEMSLQVHYLCLTGFLFLFARCKRSLYTLDTYQIYDLHTFSCILRVVFFTFLVMSFNEQSFKILVKSNLSIFPFCSVISKKPLSNSRYWCIPLLFSKICIALALIWSILSYIAYGMRMGSNRILLNVVVTNYRLLKRLLFS